MSPTRGTKIILTKWGEAENFKLPGEDSNLVGTVPLGAPWLPRPPVTGAPASGRHLRPVHTAVSRGLRPLSIVSRLRSLAGTVPLAALWVPPPSAPEAPASGHPALLSGRRTASSPSLSHSIVSRFPPHVGTPLRLSPKEGLPFSPIYISGRDR